MENDTQSNMTVEEMEVYAKELRCKIAAIKEWRYSNVLDEAEAHGDTPEETIAFLSGQHKRYSDEFWKAMSQLDEMRRATSSRTTLCTTHPRDPARCRQANW